MTGLVHTDAEVWFLTGSQALYGEETLQQVAEQSQAVAALLDAGRARCPCAWCGSRCSPAPTRSTGWPWRPTPTPACVGVIAWMHTFSPARMWIAGLDALRTPLLHLHTQANEALPWATIDMDFMNLNQAAHGDREFGYVQARLGVTRKTVSGPRERPGRARAGGCLGAGRARLGGGAVAAAVALRRHHARRRGDRGRPGRGAVAMGRHGQRLRRERPGRRRATPPTRPRSTGWSRSTPTRTRWSPELLPGGDRHESLRYSAQIEVGLREMLARTGARAFTSNFEDLAGLRQLPGMAVQRLMAEGYGFAGEGDWKTAALLRILKAAAVGLPGGTSFMEDYTYHLGPGTPKVLGRAHARGLPVDRGRATAGRDPPAGDRRPRGPGADGLRRRDPARRSSSACATSATGSDWSPTRSRWCAPDEPLPRLPVARAVWQPAPDLRTSTEAWIMAGGPHHTVLSTALPTEVLVDLAEIARTELVLIDADTTPRRLLQELRWNQAYHRLAAGF